MRKLIICVAAVIAATLLALPASALSVFRQVTAENVETMGRSFEVKVRDAGSAREFEVLVKPKAVELSPFLETTLQVYDGDTLIASCPIQKQEFGGGVMYRFQVAGKYIKSSRFSFGEFGHVKLQQKDGSVKIMSMPTIDCHWFYLGEFGAGHTAATAPAGTKLGQH